MNLKNGKVFTTKFAATGPSSYEKRIYRAAVSQRLRNTALENLKPRKTGVRISDLADKHPFWKECRVDEC
jgi:hypothetical protein